MNAEHITTLATEALAVAARATAGPWTSVPYEADEAPNCEHYVMTAGDNGQGFCDLTVLGERDAAFIAHARSSLPTLAAAVLKLALFVNHKGSCNIYQFSNLCSCGLDQALAGIGGAE